MNADVKAKSILLVDDHRDFREMLKMFIEKEFKDVLITETANARAGIEAAIREKPDAILIDVHLPGMSGIEAAAEISRRLPKCKIIAMSMFKNHDQQTFLTREEMVFIAKDEMSNRLVPLLYKFLEMSDITRRDL